MFGLIFSSEFSLLLLGFLAQALFGVRMVGQWLYSEYKGSSQTPIFFWWFSLFGATLLLMYGWFRQDLAIVFGQFLTYFIYFRNLNLKRVFTFKGNNAFIAVGFLILPIVILAFLFQFALVDFFTDIKTGFHLPFMILFGGVGYIIFNSRFIVQWLQAERSKESTLSKLFWIISLVGSIFIFLYGLYRKDIVIILSSGLGMVVYIRNILLFK